MTWSSSQKLWKVIKQQGKYYYEIKLAGDVIDRVPIDYPALQYLKSKEVI